mgnify:CR=1 FL=1
MNDKLEKREANGGRVTGTSENGFHLGIPGMPSGTYGLAQLDDYMHLPRRKFPHTPPFSLRIEARVSGQCLPGTWGFGLWNDPFSVGFGAGGMSRLLPVAPNAAWFFYGSGDNHLSLRDDLPGSGFHAKTFRSPLLPSILSLAAVPGLPLLLWPLAARFVRKLSRQVVKEDATLLDVDLKDWHAYQLDWQDDSVTFSVDGEEVFQTNLSPRGRLGLVIWMDNQFFRFDSEGQIGFGFLQTFATQILAVRNINTAVD